MFVHGLEVLGRVGVGDGERRVPRRLVIDIDVDVDCRQASAADDVGLAVDYAALAETARQAAAARQYRLVETLAESLSASILSTFPRVVGVRVRISKRSAVAQSEAVGVVLHRQREGPR